MQCGSLVWNQSTHPSQLSWNFKEFELLEDIVCSVYHKRFSACLHIYKYLLLQKYIEIKTNQYQLKLSYRTSYSCFILSNKI